MSGSDGISRLRKAVDNQASLGEASFTLPIGEMLAMLDEVEDELAALSWADSVPALVDADGEVVPLTTEVMYTDGGQKIELGEFYLLYSVLRDGFVWRAIRHIDGDIEDWKLDCLHLRRPDSWERLEEDAKLAPRAYLEKRGMNPEKTERVASMMADLVRRAKALAERDAKASTPQPLPHEVKEASRG